MFQTDIIVFLQSFASAPLTMAMKLVTATGYTQFISALVLVVMFGLNMRRGFIVFLLILWTSIAVETAKQSLALPRPAWVDSNVQNLETGEATAGALYDQGATSFFAPLPAKTLKAFRLAGGSMGFPSGHVATAVAMWGSLLMVYRVHHIRWVLPGIAVLMAISRMYLGRHFLADVLGGATIGGLLLYGTYLLLDKADWREKLFQQENAQPSLRARNVLLYFVMLLLPCLFAPVSPFLSEQTGTLVGVNGAFLLLILHGLPEDDGTFWQRLARVLLAGLVFSILTLPVRYLSDHTGLYPRSRWGVFLTGAVPGFVGILAGVAICRKFGLFPLQRKYAAAGRHPGGYDDGSQSSTHKGAAEKQGRSQ